MSATLNNKSALLAVVVVSYLMIVVDISVVITALPAIQASFEFSAAELSWVHNAYTLSFGGFLLLGARAGDLLGRRRIVLAGLSLFTLASLMVGLSQGPSGLLAGRVLQGLGAALLAPVTLALLSTHFSEGPERTRALSIHAAAAGVGTSLGLVVGGLVTNLLSWRACFFINLPIGIGLLVAARQHVTQDPPRPGVFDAPGAVLSCVGMVSLVYGLVASADVGWSDVHVLSGWIVAALAFALFYLQEARVSQPLIPLHLFASRERCAAYATRVMFLGAIVGFWFFTTQYLQRLLGYTPLQAGMAFVPTTFVHFLAALAVPRMARRIGGARVLALGLGMSILALFWLGAVAGDQPSLQAIAFPMVLVGLGQGLVFSPLTASGVAAVKREDAGAASGLVNVSHQLGGALGLSLLVIVFSRAAHGVESTSRQVANAIGATYRAGALMLSAALILTLLFIVRGTSRGTSSYS